MHRKEHEERSIETFGKPWTEIHKFLDQYFEKYWIDHRIVLHHQQGIELVVRRFGEEARSVAEQHIMDDQGSIPHDFREFDLDLEHLDHWPLGKDLKADLKQLYPDIYII